ncbi:MAG: 4Fe-4S binding protein [Kiritimatiellae bacterium]|nr:4Fe-4S binding protein [Kiritimatiellia bacterium]
MIDLSVEFAGMKLPSPVFVGSGPNTRSAESCIAALKAGAGMVEYGALGGTEQTDHVLGIDQMQILPHKRDAYHNRFFGYASTGFKRDWHAATQSAEYKLNAIRRVKAETAGLGMLVASIGSVNYRYTGKPGQFSWGEMAKMCVEAGADALILHLQTGQELAGKVLSENPDYLRDTIKEVKDAANAPVLAKLPIEGCDPAFLARLAFNAGADGVAPTARYVGLNIDIGAETVPEWHGFHGYGGPWALPITAAWTAKVRRSGVMGPMIPGGGVMSWTDIVRLILVGADVVQVCSWPILKGYGVLPKALDRIRRWMREKGYGSIDDFRGRMVVSLKETKCIWGRRFEKGPFEGVTVDPTRCTGCGACTHPCYFHAIALNGDGKAHIDPDKCVGCGHCFQVCPQDAVVVPHTNENAAAGPRAEPAPTPSRRGAERLEPRRTEPCRQIR